MKLCSRSFMWHFAHKFVKHFCAKFCREESFVFPRKKFHEKLHVEQSKIILCKMATIESWYNSANAGTQVLCTEITNPSHTIICLHLNIALICWQRNLFNIIKVIKIYYCKYDKIHIIIYLYKIAILHHGMQSFCINHLLHACSLLHDCWRHALICDVKHISSLSLQYHYASMQMNATPIDLMLGNEKQHQSNII